VKIRRGLDMTATSATIALRPVVIASKRVVRLGGSTARFALRGGLDPGAARLYVLVQVITHWNGCHSRLLLCA
jgi:hypothetical protein